MTPLNFLIMSSTLSILDAVRIGHRSPVNRTRPDPLVLLDRTPDGQPFLNLFTFLLESEERQGEYCLVLRQNADRDAVHQIHMFANISMDGAQQLLATCKLSAVEMGKVVLHPGYASEQLTYRLLLGEASKLASADTLQVVHNADIALGDWEKVRPLVGFIHSQKISLHLSWNSEIASTVDRCANPGLGSYDALAFNAGIDEHTLQTLDFYPNILGAENVVVCYMRKAGFTPINACRDLTTQHYHDQNSSRHYQGERMNTFDCDWLAQGQRLAKLNKQDAS